MAREFDHCTHHDLFLTLEPFVGPSGAKSGRLEAAISLAATVCWAWAHESGDRVILAVAGREPLVADGLGSANQALAMLECLAAVEGTQTPDLPALERRLLSVALPGGPALLVSSRR